MDFFSFKEQISKTPAAPAAGEPRDALTVTQLTAQIERALKGAFPALVLVKGEVSNFKNHGGSGHHYFTLKDSSACIDCVMFKSDAIRLRFMPEDGMELLASGRLAVYGQRGRYQLYVSRLDSLGQGALELAFRQLCARLEAEGLFAPERKKPLPAYPRTIALVTSTQTAAIQDMFKVLGRFPWLRLLVCHVPVQGAGSAERIATAIADLNGGAASVGGVDLILLARGGGSLEDLWEFNQEVLARAILASRIPIITGIGHEVDVSIADLVADHHAHTPTEAAQVAVEQWRRVRERLESSEARLRREMRTKLQQMRQQLAQIERHDVFRRPLERINRLRQLLDDRQRALALAMGRRMRGMQSQTAALAGRLDRHRPAALLAKLRAQLTDHREALLRLTSQRIRAAQEELSRVTGSLLERHPRHVIRLSRLRLESLERQLRGGFTADHQRRRQRLGALAAQLNALGPEQVLKRGYSITSVKKTGAVARAVGQVKAGDRLTTRFADGTVESIAEDRHQLPLFE